MEHIEKWMNSTFSVFHFVLWFHIILLNVHDIVKA